MDVPNDGSMQQDPGNHDQQAVLEQLTQQLGALQDKVAALEARLTQVEQTQSAPDLDTLMTIAAAAAAYLGVKGKVRAIRYAAPTRWAQVGRDTVHRHTVG
jgi:hypothetical protein